MNFTSIPIIVLCCYIIGEIFKSILKNKKETYLMKLAILSDLNFSITNMISSA